MPVRLLVNDVVLVTTAEKIQAIGVILYIGYIYGHDMTEFVGIETLEPVPGGHNGTVDNYEYFHARPHHGLHVRLTNVVRKLPASDLLNKMREVINMFQQKLCEYIKSLQLRDAYIEKLKYELKHSQHRIKNIQKHGLRSIDDGLLTIHYKNTPYTDTRVYFVHFLVFENMHAYILPYIAQKLIAAFLFVYYKRECNVHSHS